MGLVGRDRRRCDADEHDRVRFAAGMVADANLRAGGERRNGDSREQRSDGQDQAGADGTSADDW
jgi:hypothetical protein